MSGLQLPLYASYGTAAAELLKKPQQRFTVQRFCDQVALYFETANVEQRGKLVSAFDPFGDDPMAGGARPC